MRTSSDCGRTYRIWIADPGAWEPLHWQDRPSHARVIAPAAEGLFTAAQAAAFLEGFNTQLLHEPKQLWGIAVRVDVHCRGDLRPGQAWRPVHSQNSGLGAAPGGQNRRRNIDRQHSGVRPSRKNVSRRRARRRRAK